MKQKNNTYKFVVIVFLTIGALIVPSKYSSASNQTIIGFIIEAAQMEGTLHPPEMIVGDTTEQKDLPMLELTFENLSADGLIIKKLVNTPNGMITLDMTSKDSVLFNNLTLKVTNAVFGGNYFPSKGNIGLKNVKLLTHSVTTDSSNLPQFNLTFNEGGQVEMEPKSKEELVYMKAVLEKLIIRTPQ